MSSMPVDNGLIEPLCLWAIWTRDICFAWHFGSIYLVKDIKPAGYVYLLSVFMFSPNSPERGLSASGMAAVLHRIM
jgi:hypothetical protein